MIVSRRFAHERAAFRRYRDGDRIVREGEDGNEMFVIRTGAVRITKQVEGRIVVLADLGRGDFFGEMSVLESLPREADVHAVGDTEVLVLGPGALLLRLRQDPAFALEMLNRLSGRVRALNSQLVEALSKSAGARGDP